MLTAIKIIPLWAAATLKRPGDLDGRQLVSGELSALAKLTNELAAMGFKTTPYASVEVGYKLANDLNDIPGPCASTIFLCNEKDLKS